VSDSWLFAKPDSAVFVVRTGLMAVDVYGPGPARESRSFTAETDLVSFLRETDAALVASGYRPRGYGADRRSRDERRDRARAAAADRRQSSMNS
jgi:hypothetical protein